MLLSNAVRQTIRSRNGAAAFLQRAMSVDVMHSSLEAGFRVKRQVHEAKDRFPEVCDTTIQPPTIHISRDQCDAHVHMRSAREYIRPLQQVSL